MNYTPRALGIPVVGDWNGDGITDIGNWDGVWRIALGSGDGFTLGFGFAFGDTNFHLPLTGDINGDGNDDFQIELAGLHTLTSDDFVL